MTKENMIFTESVTYTMTFDKLITTTVKSLESVDENGVRSLKCYSCIRKVQDISSGEDNFGMGRAA